LFLLLFIKINDWTNRRGKEGWIWILRWISLVGDYKQGKETRESLEE
jgi:hypothetical protein